SFVETRGRRPGPLSPLAAVLAGSRRMRSETRFKAWDRESVQRRVRKSKRPSKTDAAKKMDANNERKRPANVGATSLVEVSCYDRPDPVRGRARDRIVDLFSRAVRHGNSCGIGKKYRGASFRKSERR